MSDEKTTRVRPEVQGVLGSKKRLLVIEDFEISSPAEFDNPWYSLEPSKMVVRQEGDLALRNASPVVPITFQLPDLTEARRHYRENLGCFCEVCQIINRMGGA